MLVPTLPVSLADDLTIRPARKREVEAFLDRQNASSIVLPNPWNRPSADGPRQELLDAAADPERSPPVERWFQLVTTGPSGDHLGDLFVRIGSPSRCAIVSFSVAEDGRGNSANSRAAAIVAQWLFNDVGAPRVSSTIDPDDRLSVLIAESVGMRYEGRLSCAGAGTTNADVLTFAMDRRDWNSWIQRHRGPPHDVRLVDIEAQNVNEVLDLRTHHSQETLVLPPIPRWFASVYTKGGANGPSMRPWLRAIEADERLVGALLMSQPGEGSASALIWRILIDRMHQGRGLGRRTLDLAVEQALFWSADDLLVTWTDAPGTAGPFYTDFGFETTGRRFGREIEGRLALRELLR